MSAYLGVTEFSFENVTTTDLAYDVSTDDTLVILVLAAKIYGTITSFPYFDALSVTGEDTSYPYSDASWSASDDLSNGGILLMSLQYYDSGPPAVPAGTSNRNLASLGFYSKYYASAAMGESVTIATSGGKAFEGAAHIIQISASKRLQRISSGPAAVPQDKQVTGTNMLFHLPSFSQDNAYDSTTGLGDTYVSTRGTRIVRQPGQVRFAAAVYYDATKATWPTPSGFTAIGDTASSAGTDSIMLQSWYSIPDPDTYGIAEIITPVPSVSLGDTYYFVNGHWASFGAGTQGSALLGHVA